VNALEAHSRLTETFFLPSVIFLSPYPAGWSGRVLRSAAGNAVPALSSDRLRRSPRTEVVARRDIARW